MLNVKDAVAAAESFARTMFAESELRGLRVEEIESAKEGNHWLITLGWPETAVRNVTSSAFGVSSGGVYASPRVYKQFTIDAETGVIVAMKVRDI